MARFKFTQSRIAGSYLFRYEPVLDPVVWVRTIASNGGRYGLRSRLNPPSNNSTLGAEYGEILFEIIRWCDTEFGARAGRWSFKYGRKLFAQGPGIHQDIPRGSFMFNSANDATLFRLRWT